MGMSRSDAGKLGALKSKETQKAKWKALRKAYAFAPKRCLTCAKPFPYRKRRSRFCDCSCAAIFNNPKRAKQRFCGHCKTLLTGSQKKYCGNRCFNFQKLADTNERVRAGEVSDSKTLRRFLLGERPHQCVSCDRTEWLGEPIPLEVDHVDGDHKNNYPKNLRLLCPNCHTRTPTYKGKNKGKGRSKRMVRYYAGKTY